MAAHPSALCLPFSLARTGWRITTVRAAYGDSTFDDSAGVQCKQFLRASYSLHCVAAEAHEAGARIAGGLGERGGDDDGLFERSAERRYPRGIVDGGTH